MRYLGKSYLHKFLKENGFNPPMFKSMAYGKYRGDEWLENAILAINCFRGNVISVCEREYDKERAMFFIVSSYAYILDENGEWIKMYERQWNKILVSRV